MMEEVLFKGKHFRGDIAAKALHRYVVSHTTHWDSLVPTNKK
tara:strand:+ start:993 stop:1118 length:126 start_codon:yes stop_codon:yes gene_type:complete